MTTTKPNRQLITHFDAAQQYLLQFLHLSILQLQFHLTVSKLKTGFDFQRSFVDFEMGFQRYLFKTLIFSKGRKKVAFELRPFMALQ